MLIEKDMAMADVALHDYKLIPVISRFGIKMGYGNKTIEELCKEKNIDIRFFLTILNAFHDANYFPHSGRHKPPLHLLIDYLKRAHTEYLTEKLPAIGKLIGQMTEKCSLDESTYRLFLNFYDEYKNELTHHIQREEEKVYPYAVALEEAVTANKPSPETKALMEAYPVSKYEKEHENVEEKLTDLKNLMIKHLPTLKEDKHCFVILNELSTFEKELGEHTRIENMMLIPEIKEFEQLLQSKTV